MNPVRPQNTPESPTLLNDLKAEVSAESAPLLQFIVRNSGLIVGVVVVLLVALVGTAVWRWHQGGLQAEAQTELARIGITMKGGDRLKALDDLAAKASENMRYSIYLMQAEFAMQDQDYSRAEQAYATAAKLDADGAMGLMAALGQAGALIKLDRPADAVTLLQGLESRATEDGRATLRMLLGEAAEAAGKTDVAVAAYEALAASQPGLDGEFYRSRAEALGGGKTAPVKDGAENK